jgi:dephospho-CoA kinase
MPASLILLTGASGVGKTSIALAIEKLHPEFSVFRSDAIIGVPTSEEMAARYGPGLDAGAIWQREVTLQWVDRLATIVASGKNVVLDFQTRIAFLLEALAVHDIPGARVVLVECDDQTRTARLTHGRQQPELANEQMSSWSRYLHQEAIEAGCEIIDTTSLTIRECVQSVIRS